MDEEMDAWRDKVTFNRDSKFDLQLARALIDERHLADIFAQGCIEKIELKSEQWQWERTGNLAIEFRRAGRPSGISVTEADYWVHELKRDGETIGYFMFPVERLKVLCREAYRQGHVRLNCGDDNLSDVVLISLKDLLS